MRLPGVHRAGADTALLVDQMLRGGLVSGRAVLDVGTGTGAVAIAAARAGAGCVTAVDLSWRSVRAARLNARRHGVIVDVRRGDLFAPVAGLRFDLIVSNPPDGRAVLDRLCAGAAEFLTADGEILLVHPSRNGVQATVDALAAGGFLPTLHARVAVPSRPVPPARAEELVVVGGVR